MGMPSDESVAAKPKGRVLIADDEPALLLVLARVLRLAGYDVESVADGSQAAQLVATREFDVIVSDVAMPQMDGLQLLRLVRGRNLDVPLILMTGAPSVATAVSAVELGVLRYLIKPFEGVQLVEVVDQAVRLHELARLKRQALELLGNTSVLPGDRVGLAASLDRALASMWMAYQPIVPNNGGQVFAYEALMRSNEPTLPHPGAVLEAAERLGRIHDVGRRVRSLVASRMGEMPAEYAFVNLHPRDLMDEDLFDTKASLSRVATRVVYEITERATLDEVKNVVDRISKLREMGFGIALDDLGAGYAGLSSFAKIHPDIVKIDMSLVRGVDGDAVKRKLIESLTSLCRGMNMKVVAEGVETQEECDVIITSCGCDLLQGYFFAKPSKDFALADRGGKGT